MGPLKTTAAPTVNPGQPYHRQPEPISWSLGPYQNDARTLSQAWSARPSAPNVLPWCHGYLNQHLGLQSIPVSSIFCTKTLFQVPRIPSERHPDLQSIPVSPIFSLQKLFPCATEPPKTTPGPTVNTGQPNLCPYGDRCLIPRTPSKRHSGLQSIPVSPTFSLRSTCPGTMHALETTPGLTVDPVRLQL